MRCQYSSTLEVYSCKVDVSNPLLEIFTSLNLDVYEMSMVSLNDMSIIPPNQMSIVPLFEMFVSCMSSESLTKYDKHNETM